MKKILFDLSSCQPAGKTKFHGGGVYGYIVFKALAEKYPHDVIAYYDDSRFLPEDILSLVREKNITVRLAKDKTIPELYEHSEFERLYTPLWRDEYGSFARAGVPITVTEHGLRNLEMNTDVYEPMFAKGFSEYIKALLKQTFMRRMARKGHLRKYGVEINYPGIRIVTVSEHSKASICRYYPSVDPDSIKVLYSPNTSEPVSDDNDPADGKYYLVVSANRWLKNPYRTIRALDGLFTSHPHLDGKVILLGLGEDSRLLSRVRNRDRFITKGYVDRDELERLFKGAYALLYPSLNEGFGYPPIEAMKYGVPVIASSFSSISEICGDAPLYVNPYSEDEIATRVLQLEDRHIFESRREASLERYRLIEERQRRDLDTLVDYIMS